MLVHIQDLKQIFENMIDKLEEVSPTAIELNFTTYWTLSFNDGQKLNPPSPFVCDIRDDWKNIKKELDSKRRLTQKDFESLGNVFKAIGLKVDLLEMEKKR